MIDAEAIGLSESVLQQILQQLKVHEAIEKAVLYGSRAMGNFKVGSDIDLTLMGRKIGLQDLNRIALALDDLLLPYEFDLSIYDCIENNELREHIKRVGITIFRKEQPSESMER